jgi:hypothetical protein
MKDCKTAAAATLEIPASFATLSISSALVMVFSPFRVRLIVHVNARETPMFEAHYRKKQSVST